MATTTMNISLPESMKGFIETRVQQGGYGTTSEFFRDLVRQEQVKEAEQGLALHLARALGSGEPIPVDENYWKAKHAALEKRLPKSKKASRHNTASRPGI